MSDRRIKKPLAKVRAFLHLDKLEPWQRKIVVGLLGGIILLAGTVMIVTPGPAFVLIPLGLFLLASEFKFAEKAAKKLLDFFSKLRRKWRKKRRAAR